VTSGAPTRRFRRFSNARSACRFAARTPEAARFLGLSSRTLEEHRSYGTGPAYRKLGARVVYALDDLQAWVQRGKKTSTSDPGAGTVLPAKRHAPIPYAGSAIWKKLSNFNAYIGLCPDNVPIRIDRPKQVRRCSGRESLPSAT